MREQRYAAFTMADSSALSAKLRAIFGDPDEGAVRQIVACLADERAIAGALMADHHLGYSMPIGGVVAYAGAISPSGVGFDIACGNKAVRTDIRADEVDVEPTLREIERRVAFGIGRKKPDPVDSPVLGDERWKTAEEIDPKLRSLARDQLGTVGSGNHYVDLLADEDGWLWIACHFGSRGFGHKVASGFLSLAAGRAFGDRVPEREEPTVLDVDSPSGAVYLELMALAGDYAYAGRDVVVDQLLDILDSPQVTESVHCHHNFAWLENGLYVVRKGATPLTDTPAFIGGSMGDISVVVRGTGEEIGALGSAPHGAGRAISRTRAAGKWKKVVEKRTRPDGTTYTFKRRIRDRSTALIDFDEVKADLARRGIAVRGAGADEAPAVYKDLRTVLGQHPNIRVEHTLRPIGVVMAGEDVFDPYKD